MVGSISTVEFNLCALLAMHPSAVNLLSHQPVIPVHVTEFAKHKILAHAKIFSVKSL